MKSFQIREGELEDAVRVSHQIPEFENPYPLEEYQHRLEGVPHHIGTAYVENEPIGFKVGYQRENDGSFYTWMGGVLPEYRRWGIADALAHIQEKWAEEHGYQSIALKTRLKYPAMIQFSKNRGFSVIDTILKKPYPETRVWMKKIL